MQGLAAAVIVSHRDGDEVVNRRRDIQGLASVADGDRGRFAHPQQIGSPKLRWDGLQRRPALQPEASLVPGLIREAWHVEIGPCVILGAAQRAHARIARPWALASVLGLVDRKRVLYLRPLQREDDRKTALAGAQDEDVERRFAVWSHARLQPGHRRMSDAGKIAPRFGRERSEALPLRALLFRAHFAGNLLGPGSASQSAAP